MNNQFQIIGPFRQLITMSKLNDKGSISDSELIIIQDAGIVTLGQVIVEIGEFYSCVRNYRSHKAVVFELNNDYVGLPGLIDAHTHICFAGSRASDFSKRNAGMTYLEIAKEGGGIWDTVIKTRSSSQDYLSEMTLSRANQLLQDGITTIEVKSGYGLSVEEELKMLRSIKSANKLCKADLIATCLAAHIFPKSYSGNINQYVSEISNELLPIVKEQKLATRVDAFIEEEAFNDKNIRTYLEKAKELELDITIHADQFSPGGSSLAIEYDALSADHLEASTTYEIAQLAKSNVIATALPGASIGLGVAFAPARKLLDAGCSLCIASDWNPGSAPMGDLLAQASILATYEKLSTAEVLAGITCRAARALSLQDRGILEKDKLADIIAFQTNDYREVLYHQGKMKPELVWKKGENISQ